MRMCTGQSGPSTCLHSHKGRWGIRQSPNISQHRQNQSPAGMTELWKRNVLPWRPSPELLYWYPLICLYWRRLIWRSGVTVVNTLRPALFNTLRPRQNGRQFGDGHFKFIFLSRKYCYLIKMSLQFVCNGPINKKQTLFQIMAWRRTGAKPLSDSMMALFTGALLVLHLV